MVGNYEMLLWKPPPPMLECAAAYLKLPVWIRTCALASISAPERSCRFVRPPTLLKTARCVHTRVKSAYAEWIRALSQGSPHNHLFDPKQLRRSAHRAAVWSNFLLNAARNRWIYGSCVQWETASRGITFSATIVRFVIRPCHYKV